MFTTSNIVCNQTPMSSASSSPSSSPRSSSGSSGSPPSLPPPPSYPPGSFFCLNPGACGSFAGGRMDLNVAYPYYDHNNSNIRDCSASSAGGGLPLNVTTQVFLPPPPQNFVLQDFLGLPFHDDPPPPSVPTLFGIPLLPPTTVLTLNSAPPVPAPAPIPAPGPSPVVQSNPIPVPVLDPVPNVTPRENSSPCSSPSPSPQPVRRNRRQEGNRADRRYQRMIKNRESAARSRARKMAYTSELKLEIAILMEENEQLKEQEKKLRMAAEAQLPLSRRLRRCASAPP